MSLSENKFAGYLGFRAKICCNAGTNLQNADPAVAWLHPYAATELAAYSLASRARCFLR